MMFLINFLALNWQMGFYIKLQIFLCSSVMFNFKKNLHSYISVLYL